ncbi:MAG: DUF2804 domain-containing protein [Desulfobacterales bacterium]|nr:DUF2804 domain-containing protein [Desulfobacterales bacterium]
MDPYSREVLPAPKQLVSKGRFAFGTFNSAFEIVNPLDAHSPLGLPLPRWVKHLRLKEWQAVQMGNADWFMLAVVYNAKTVCLAQFVLVDRKNRQKILYERKIVPWAARVASSLAGTETAYRGKHFSIAFENDLEAGRIGVEVNIRSQKGLPDVTGRFTGLHVPGRVTPMVICQPFGPNRALYSHKCLMPMEGHLALGGDKIDFSSSDSFMILDDHKGYYPYAMRYDWVTAAGFDARGRRVGFNFTDNQVLDHHRYNENCLWIDNRCLVLPPIHVTRPQGVDSPWTVQDDYGQVDLVFTPQYPGTVKINALVIKSDYYGPYGSFAGFIRADGEELCLDGFFGMGEKKYVRS